MKWMPTLGFALLIAVVLLGPGGSGFAAPAHAAVSASVSGGSGPSDPDWP